LNGSGRWRPERTGALGRQPPERFPQFALKSIGSLKELFGNKAAWKAWQYADSYTSWPLRGVHPSRAFEEKIVFGPLKRCIVTPLWFEIGRAAGNRLTQPDRRSNGPIGLAPLDDTCFEAHQTGRIKVNDLVT